MIDTSKVKRAQKVVAAYKTVFTGDAGQTVLVDLMKKCFFTAAVTEKDPVIPFPRETRTLRAPAGTLRLMRSRAPT